jgi:hypothetical protein
MAQESKTKRRKLKAHDRGEDRHNKGLSLIKKERRLEEEHQAALRAAIARRHKKINARRISEGRQHRQSSNRQQMGLAALEEMTHNLFEAAGVDRQRLAQFYQEPAQQQQQRRPEPRKKREASDLVPTTVYTTYRVRRVDSEETTLVQGTIKLPAMRVPALTFSREDLERKLREDE